jgi:hypothetical protein
MEEEKPPFLKSWRNVYLLVVLVLVVQIVVYYLFTKYFE